QFLATLLPQVDRDSEFLDVVVVERAAEVDAAAIVDEWWNAAQDVPGPLPDGVLDADHLRAERGEEFRGSRAGELPGEVADGDVREGRRPRGRQSHGRLLVRDTAAPHPTYTRWCDDRVRVDGRIAGRDVGRGSRGAPSPAQRTGAQPASPPER